MFRPVLQLVGFKILISIEICFYATLKEKPTVKQVIYLHFVL